MRVLIFAVILCLGISPIFVSSQGCNSSNCITSQTYRPFVTSSVIEGADYILNTTKTISTIGSSLYKLIENIDDRDAIGDLLNSIITPTLTYLVGVNDTILRPFHPEIFQLIDDLAYELTVDLSSNPTQSAANLVNLLERGINLGVNITRVLFGNDSEVDMIVSIITDVLNVPGLKDNITCILTEVLSDPSIGQIVSQVNALFNMTKDITIARPILQLFNDSDLFYNKFAELFNYLPNSNGIPLCVDAFLTNLVCPFESRYCHANCADTLVYCTALLSQSLQDFSDVLDAIPILAAGYVNSDEFGMYFNQIRNELLSTVNNSLALFNEFNIVDFVNMTLTDCNLIPIIEQLLSSFGIFPPNITVGDDAIRAIILTSLSNVTNIFPVDPNGVIYVIEQQLNLEGIRSSLTNLVYNIPNGFLLDGILSLSIYYTLLYRPPQGCGQPSTTYSPLAFLPHYGYFFNCFDGTSVVSYDPNSYYYGSLYQYSFSYNHIDYSNQAANRTCTFNKENFFNATIVTDTNLCEAFLPLYQQSVDILRGAINSYGKLQFCNSFIGNATPPIDCITNDCITSQQYRPLVTSSVIEGASYILNTTKTVSTIGTSVYKFIENINDRIAIRELLDSIITPTLTYLVGVNDTILRPFHPEIFQLIDDLAYELSMDLSSNPAQSAENLVDLLERGINLGVNITRVLFGNDPGVESIVSIITGVLNIPGLKDNITCVLTRVLSDPSIGQIVSQVNALFNMTKDITIARPILQLFNDSNLFYNKFSELYNYLPNSNGIPLCVDAFLTNLVCPFESRYCRANCAETLVYCTALLSQSLQDFSDVLDAIPILAAGYVNSNEYGMYFNQIRNELLSTVNNSLTLFKEFDIVDFVNMTLTDCELIPFIQQLLSSFGIFPPNITVGDDAIRAIILTGLSNVTNILPVDPNVVIYVIEQQFNLDSIRSSLTNLVYSIPNGFLLDGILSLSIYYTLLYRPPQGCGQPSTTYSPLEFTPHYGYNTNCFDGNSVVFYDPKSYNYGYLEQYSFSYYYIDYSNQAANRTCTFNKENFFNATIVTDTNLCEAFLPLYQQSVDILRGAINSYGKLQFCNSFIGNATPPIECITNDCITSQQYRPFVTSSVLEGVDYILNTTKTVSTIGSSLYKFIENIDNYGAIGQLLDSIITPTLRYLVGVNDTILRPFHPQIFQFIDDLAYELSMDLSSNPAQSAENLVDLLERGINLGVNITRVLFGNDPEVESIVSIITGVLNIPGLKDNITCVLTRVLSDPSIGQIVSQVNALFNMTKNITIARPILQLFNDSDLFYNKFAELFNYLPNSNGVSLCVDAFLTNLVCPFESRYCHANCAETLVYCTALLSQSLQDFSDVLDAIPILAAGYVNSDEFGMYFNQIRNELLSTVNSSLAIFYEFDIVEFVNMTLTNCELIPLIEQLLSSFGAFPPNITVGDDAIRAIILTGLSNVTNILPVDPNGVIYVIEQQLNLEGIRSSLTNLVYSIPNGFLLDGILSLSIYYTLLYRPPQGCGEPSTTYSPLEFLPHYGYNTNCFDGNSVVFYDPKSYYYGYLQQYNFSYFAIDYSNQAANRTCTFNKENFFNATIVTDTNLCEAFLPLYQQSVDILRNAIDYQDKLQFCINFIGNATPPIDCITNDCITSQTYRPLVTSSVIEGADYILNTTKTVSTIGTSVYKFIENIDEYGAIGELLNSIITPTLTYLVGVNDTLLRPFHPEIFQLIDDLAYELSMDLSSNPAQSAENLVDLLERGINLGINITRVLSGNDPGVESIVSIITGVLNVPGLKDNITCVLTRVLSDPSIGQIVSQVNALFNMTKNITIARPILQLFNDSDLFYNKFSELYNYLPNSNGIPLCVDAFLTNLVCPFESRYCRANCADTLVYCTALLSQSLQDFSDVLDAIPILAAGYVNSDEFGMYFNQIRNELLSTVNNSLTLFKEFDIVDFVNMTLTDCELIPLIEQLLSSFGAFPPNITVDEEALRAMILSVLSDATNNLPVDPNDVKYVIEQQFNLEGLRNLTYLVYSIPNGFLLDGILSLSIYYTLLYRPPQGCGQPSTTYSPLEFTPHYGYNTNCFDGNSVVFYDPKSYNYGYLEQYSFSYYYIDYSNQAANRTCTFNKENFFAAGNDTAVDLCTVFLSLNPDSRTILRYSVTTYNKLSFCSSFILANVTEPITAPTTVTTPSTTVTIPSTTVTTPSITTPTPVPIIAPTVSFPTPKVIASLGIPFYYPCSGTGTNVMVSIVLLNDAQIGDFSQVFTQSGSTLIFNSSMPGNFTFECTGVNSIGTDTVFLTIEVRTLSENIDMINSIVIGEPIPPEAAVALVSILTSVLSSDAIQENSDDSEQLLDVTGAVVDSLTEGRNISEGEAESVLLLLAGIETIPDQAGTTDAPVITDEVLTVNVPRAALIVAQAVGRIASNLALQAVVGNPPRLISSGNINITVAAVLITSTIESIPVALQNDEGASINLPSNNFPPGAIVNIGASVRRSPLRITRSADGTVAVTNIPQLNSDLISLDVILNSQPVDIFTLSPDIDFSTSNSNNDNTEQICIFLNETTGQFSRSGVSTTINAGSVSCKPNHTTSFGVLIRAQDIQVSEAETLALSIVSYVLLSISLIFLVISIIFFLVSSKKFFKVETNILYFNFAIAMALAISVFIFGIQTAKDSEIGCCIVAFLLHYFWLSVFSWSFSISIFMIYILYFGVFKRQRIWWLIMIMGWGIPVPIAVITIVVGLLRGSYATTGDHCFLSYTYGLIWAFLGPFVILITFSLIGAICASGKIFLTVRNKGDTIDDVDAMKKMVVTLLVLIPVLSIPWILGIVNAFITASIATTIIEWVSILLTAPIGLLFFLLVVLRNAQVQEVVFRRKPQGPTSSQQSQQTSGTTASKYTLPSKAKGSSDAALEKVEPIAITNPAYESSTVMERPVDKKDLEKTEAFESYPEREDIKSNLYTTLETGTEEKESPLHKYAEL